MALTRYHGWTDVVNTLKKIIEKESADETRPEGSVVSLISTFIEAVAKNDPSRLLSGPDETLESHLMVFAAEQARRENRVVDMV
ncbi:MAG: hypothetical protein DRR19_29095 [Candidatus Parabeggiatoa sp. nov. 1]|nr:MAG: hypothetical protein DRR19_29095 [Gammaproteobacteria bacterium]